MQWEISLAMGWALIHAARIEDGHAMVWEDRRLSKRGRWWERVMRRFGGESE